MTDSTIPRAYFLRAALAEAKAPAALLAGKSETSGAEPWDEVLRALRAIATQPPSSAKQREWLRLAHRLVTLRRASAA
ncbi:MAG: hypothetical protein HY246_20330 [Proteobacteria bacterium]|nr:hypothetical protein [Pseudomonadota bacterium]